MLCPAFPRLPGVVGARFNERLAALSAAVRSWKAATWKPEAEHHQGQVPCHFGGPVWWEYVARAPNHEGQLFFLDRTLGVNPFLNHFSGHRKDKLVSL